MGPRAERPATSSMAHTSSRFSGYDLKADITSGFLVFLIALPLSLGIAMASGFPPIAGVLTAIVGGTVTSFLGSARLTIKGPAAGLIVIVIGAVTELSEGDPLIGYQRTLAVGVVAGLIQIGLAVARLGFIGSIMPPAVVHGMLAAIGVIIISKQAHTLVGVAPAAKTPLPLLGEIPHSLANLNPAVFLIGALALAVLFGMPLLKAKVIKRIPAPLVVLLVAIPLATSFGFAAEHSYSFAGSSYTVGPKLLVQLRSLVEAVTLPDWSHVTSGPSLKYIALFVMVGSIESLLSASAVDALDPARRASDMDKDLLAVGIGNTLAAFLGGLPMISEIVRSKANIDNGATSPIANFSHGTFLLLFVVLLPGLLQMIPLAALAAMLVFTGTRLASPREFAHALHVGREQLAVFLVTLAITVGEDLLLGVFAGLILTVVIHVMRGAPIARLFKSDIVEDRRGDTVVYALRGCAVFTNLRGLTRRLERLGDDVRHVEIDFSQCRVVDHTTQNRLELISNEWPDRDMKLIGLERLQSASSHAHAERWLAA